MQALSDTKKLFDFSRTFATVAVVFRLEIKILMGILWK